MCHFKLTRIRIITRSDSRVLISVITEHRRPFFVRSLLFFHFSSCTWQLAVHDRSISQANRVCVCASPFSFFLFFLVTADKKTFDRDALAACSKATRQIISPALKIARPPHFSRDWSPTDFHRSADSRGNSRSPSSFSGTFAKCIVSFYSSKIIPPTQYWSLDYYLPHGHLSPCPLPPTLYHFSSIVRPQSSIAKPLLHTGTIAINRYCS